MKLDMAVKLGVWGLNVTEVIEYDPMQDEMVNELLPPGNRISLEGLDPKLVCKNIMAGKWLIPWADVLLSVPVSSFCPLEVTAIDNEGIPTAREPL